MSIDIDWDALTTGPEGLALSESIRDFIHDKFQLVEFPRFIRSVQVHSFDFGKECPVIELKDICDPLSEFYEHGDTDEDGNEHQDDGEIQSGTTTLRHSNENQNNRMNHLTDRPPSLVTRKPSDIHPKPTGLRLNLGLSERLTAPLLSRSSTPGIPGGTSNLSYFHLPLSAGLSGSQTPLAVVAGGTPFATGRDYHPLATGSQSLQNYHQNHRYDDLSSRPPTADSYATSSDPRASRGLTDEPNPNVATKEPSPDPMDTQLVLHISYHGTVCLSITAEILLDYPMPSFISIPLKLNITGLSFDGVALVAYLRKRAHFCFLGPEDAHAMIGADTPLTEGGHDKASRGNESDADERVGGLLREIRVESEIGRKENGKQVLKNVGKVEKFILEQVRRIFEDEFVWPSFWTFLV